MMREASAGGRFVRAPDIAIEILSPGSSNERRDRHVKLNLYSERGVTEYWIVDPDNREIEIYRHRANALSLAAKLSTGAALTSPELPGFTVTVDSVFSDLPMR